MFGTNSRAWQQQQQQAPVKTLPLLVVALTLWIFLTILTLHQEQCRQAILYDIVHRRPYTSFERLNSILTTPQTITKSAASVASSDESVTKENVTCDFSHFRTDVCYVQGDVRVHGRAGTVSLADSSSSGPGLVARVKPYTRKWEESCMQTIGEVRVQKIPPHNLTSCDVHHKVPAVVFSTGGYTGNVYHEFNDGLIPLFITSSGFKGEVVFLVLELHSWWMVKYGSVISHLSKYPVLDFDRSDKVHCFPQVTVGMRIHNELSIDEEQDKSRLSMLEFQKLLRKSFDPNKVVVESLVHVKMQPKLVLLTRKRSRVLLNQNSVVKLAREVGFRVECLQLNSHTELWKVYQLLQSAHVLVGVHGAALTHELFLRPGSVMIQIVPLGTDWAARSYYGEPAVKMGLAYMEYRILPEESSLVKRFGRNHSVVVEPERIAQKGWWEMKKVYLEQQDVRIKLTRFRRFLRRAYMSTTTTSKL